MNKSSLQMRDKKINAFLQLMCFPEERLQLRKVFKCEIETFIHYPAFKGQTWKTDWLYFPWRRAPAYNNERLWQFLSTTIKTFCALVSPPPPPAETEANTCGLLGYFSHFWHHCVILLHSSWSPGGWNGLNKKRREPRERGERLRVITAEWKSSRKQVISDDVLIVSLHARGDGDREERESVCVRLVLAGGCEEDLKVDEEMRREHR